ncbi:hypothetical protein [Demequina soli]|uniref:hypothetical protein n=1 Tax=Demequina soli TaxID=1638987 RepID=UPI0007811514|nr:hypothetical protein [Demequina soli]
MVHTAEGAARRFERRDVRVREAALHPSGLRALRLAVGDESDDESPDPGTHLSPVSTGVFAEWSARVGTPAALPNVYVPHAARLSTLADGVAPFSGATLDGTLRRHLTHDVDARAVRVRARVLQWLAVRSVIDVDRTVRWTSLACGPAFPLIGAMSAAADARADVFATFVETCTDVLAASRRVALWHGIDPAAHEFIAASPFDGLAARIGAETQDLVEALGLLDSVEPHEAASALAEAYALVRPGGSFVFSTMLEERPRPSGVVAWPPVRRRTLEDVAALLAVAGIPVADALVCLADDGVYAVVEVARP